MSHPTISLATLVAYQARGHLRVQSHPTLPLQIWNYSQQVQAHKGPWDEITTQCRGLIVDTRTEEIVARAFPKFWNDGERNTPQDLTAPQSSPSAGLVHKVFEKLDGSLGILFHYNDNWIISSRGSFVSQQSQRATELLARYDLTHLDTTLTYVCEIIYPQNRIVVDYGTTEALYYLAAFHPDGTEHDGSQHAQQAGFPLCPVYPEYATYSLEDLKALNTPNREGFVVRYASGMRLKVKFPSYLELHRTATVSTTILYEAFCKQMTLPAFLETIPDEFHQWATEQWSALRAQYDAILEPLQTIVAQYAHLSPRDFAAHVNACPQKTILFHLRVNKDPFPLVCKCLVPPKEETKWRCAPSRFALPPFEQHITLMIGVSGSGKSTKAQQLLSSRTLIVSRDTLRQSFPQENYYESTLLPQREEWITEAQHQQIAVAQQSRFHVIIDDTNLAPKTIKQIMERHSSARFDYHVMDTPLPLAIERAAKRTRPVHASVVKAQYEKLQLLLPQLPQIFHETPLPLSIDSNSNPNAIIVDLDGTLAHMTGRNAYDHTRVEEDLLDQTVYEVMTHLPYIKVLCSGRSEEAREGTERWLHTHHVEYAELHLRKKGDTRPDTVIKEEMWRALAIKYNIKLLLDDRQCVVDHGRRLGLKVWQVQAGNF